MSGGLSSFAFGAGCYVVFDEFSDVGPPVSPSESLEGFSDAGVACKVMIMVNLC